MQRQADYVNQSLITFHPRPHRPQSLHRSFAPFLPRFQLQRHVHLHRLSSRMRFVSLSSYRQRRKMPEKYSRAMPVESGNHGEIRNRCQLQYAHVPRLATELCSDAQIL